MVFNYFLIILVAALIIYIFYLYQAMNSDNTCYAALFASLCQRIGARSSGQLAKYKETRAELLQRERKKQFGGHICLTALEKEVDAIILREKQKEYDAGVLDPKNFKPSRHFFSVLDDIDKSVLFQMIRTMPKGAILHTHDLALASQSVLMEMSYRDNLWADMAQPFDQLKFFNLRFSKKEPPPEQGTWILLKDLRKSIGAAKVDEALKLRFVLYPREQFVDQNEVWDHFMGVFILVTGMLTYEPIWREFYKKGLQEIYDDGVQYVEIRSILPIVYDLDGKEYTEIDSARIWNEETIKFVKSHPEFVGAKLIYAPLRSVSDDVFDFYMKTTLKLKEELPDFLAGFDTVGHEDNARTLMDFAEQLLTIQNKVNFYFHAGETNWFGTPTDENLIDAVMLGTKRIGHGYALIKHPELLTIIKQHDIAIEVCPISNQVLCLVSDLRNHPCAYLFAENYPVVISSDDNMIFKSLPLSHDFYVAFVGIASRSAGLGMLKKLAWNSIKYSSLDDEMKDIAFDLFLARWNKWLKQVVEFKPIEKRSSVQVNKRASLQQATLQPVLADAAAVPAPVQQPITATEPMPQPGETSVVQPGEQAALSVPVPGQELVSSAQQKRSSIQGQQLAEQSPLDAEGQGKRRSSASRRASTGSRRASSASRKSIETNQLTGAGQAPGGLSQGLDSAKTQNAPQPPGQGESLTGAEQPPGGLSQGPDPAKAQNAQPSQGKGESLTGAGQPPGGLPQGPDPANAPNAPPAKAQGESLTGAEQPPGGLSMTPDPANAPNAPPAQEQGESLTGAEQTPGGLSQGPDPANAPNAPPAQGQGEPLTGAEQPPGGLPQGPDPANAPNAPPSSG